MACSGWHEEQASPASLPGTLPGRARDRVRAGASHP